MPGFVGFPEILLLGLVVLLIFGPKRLPEMGRSLGKGMREFKHSLTGEHTDQLVIPVAAMDSPDAVPADTRPLVSVGRDHDAVA